MVMKRSMDADRTHLMSKRSTIAVRMRTEEWPVRFARKEDKMKKLLPVLGGVLVWPLGANFALAAAEGATAAVDSQAKAAIAIAAGVAVAIAAFGAALGQGRVGAAAMESIGRNPNAADRLFLPLVLTLALLEALALYGFVIAIILTGKI